MLIPWRKRQDPHNCSYQFHLLKARGFCGRKTRLGLTQTRMVSHKSNKQTEAHRQISEFILVLAIALAVQPSHLTAHASPSARTNMLLQNISWWNWSKEISPTIQPLLFCFICGKNLPPELEVFLNRFYWLWDTPGGVCLICASWAMSLIWQR